MKLLTSQLFYFTKDRTTKRNFLLLAKFFLLLGVMISVYSVIFHLIMLHEGKEYSWLTGFYWTFTVMSTLGFGDITFGTDLGKLFSIVVLLSGIIFLLIILPFSFIQFFYAPWLEAQSKSRTPRELPEDTEGHIIITNLDPITKNLIRSLEQYNYDYALLSSELPQALSYHDLGYRVVFGDPTDPETYKRLRVDKAALVVVTDNDMVNTNISFTIREISPTVPIVTSADEEHSIDILEFAGSTHIFQFMKMLGNSLGRRTLGVSMGTNIIWKLDELLIAEAPAMRTSLEGKTLVQARLRETTGVTVVGMWERGKFEVPGPESVINTSTVLMLAGSKKQLARYDKLHSIICTQHLSTAPVLILGGGRVGRAAAQSLEEHNICYKIIDKNERVAASNDKFTHGNAADINVLEKAGIRQAPSVIITTHNDAMNIYLTIYCRQLRPDIQIISRANRIRTISKLHRAGADLVMSYASMGASTIFNLLRADEMLMVVEGLSVFRTRVPSELSDSSLAENRLREKTSCSVVAVSTDNELILSPDPHIPLRKNDELILIGTVEAERMFMEKYFPSKSAINS